MLHLRTMLTLHIGRHKTGTSSIQNFLHRNRDALREYGILYPEPIGSNVSHPGIPLAIQEDKDLALYRKMVERWCNEDLHVVVSSEAFQNVHPKKIARVFDPGTFNVIVYLREHFSYAWASYVQKAWGGGETRPFDEYLSDFNPDYHVFLSRWEAECGELSVRIFDRRRLVGGNSVIDFLSFLGVPIEPFDTALSVNPTLGWRPVELIRRVNLALVGRDGAREVRHRIWTGLVRISERYPSLREKPLFDPSMIESYRARFRKSDGAVFSAYFGSDQDLFDYTWIGDSEWNSAETLSADQIEALYEERPQLRALAGDLIARAAAG